MPGIQEKWKKRLQKTSSTSRDGSSKINSIKKKEGSNIGAVAARRKDWKIGK